MAAPALEPTLDHTLAHVFFLITILNATAVRNLFVYLLFLLTIIKY
jgi:hypothetical protein